MCSEDSVLVHISFQVLVYILPKSRTLQVPQYEPLLKPPHATDICNCLVKIIHVICVAFIFSKMHPKVMSEFHHLEILSYWQTTF